MCAAMKHALIGAIAPAALALSMAGTAHAEPVPAPSPAEIVATAPAGDWVRIAPTDLMVMDLAADARGRARRVVIQLMPPPFSQGWVGNIRVLAAAHWWDGLSVNRVQDNYVVQWGDAEGEDAAKARALPAGLTSVPAAQYDTRVPWVLLNRPPAAPEFGSYPRLRDATAAGTSFAHGWPIGIEYFARGKGPSGSDGKDADPQTAWPVHCYGMVGVGRSMPPDTGSGAELYVVIGQAPRHLDRNIALVGRVIEGIEHLSSLPRGTGALGFYETAAERVPIVSIRLAGEIESDKPLPAFEYLSTESASFARYLDARTNRRDAFFIRPAGGVDVCNVPVPVRRVAQ